MDKYSQLAHFINAGGVSCTACKHFNKDNWDCTNESTARVVTNKLDFGTHLVYPIATALRVATGSCGIEAKHFKSP